MVQIIVTTNYGDVFVFLTFFFCFFLGGGSSLQVSSHTWGHVIWGKTCAFSYIIYDISHMTYDTSYTIYYISYIISNRNRQLETSLFLLLFQGGEKVWPSISNQSLHSKLISKVSRHSRISV